MKKEKAVQSGKRAEFCNFPLVGTRSLLTLKTPNRYHWIALARLFLSSTFLPILNNHSSDRAISPPIGRQYCPLHPHRLAELQLLWSLRNRHCNPHGPKTSISSFRSIPNLHRCFSLNNLATPVKPAQSGSCHCTLQANIKFWRVRAILNEILRIR